MSPHEYSPDHCIQKELEDLGSLLAKTGAHFVFGQSSGAVIALEASRVLSSIHKAVSMSRRFILKVCPMIWLLALSTKSAKESWRQPDHGK
jgi:hypothetical protein